MVRAQPRQQAVVGHRQEHARLAEHHHDHDRRRSRRWRRASRASAGCSAVARSRCRLRGMAASMATAIGAATPSLGVGHEADHHARDQHVEDGAHHQRPEDADRHVLLRVLGFLCGGRHRVEADEGEEDDAGAADDAAPAVDAPNSPVVCCAGMNGDQLPVLMNIEPAAITSSTTATLMMTITALTLADSWMPTTSNAVTSTVMSTAGRLKTAVTADPSASVITDRAPRSAPAGNWMPTSCRKLITYPTTRPRPWPRRARTRE